MKKTIPCSLLLGLAVLALAGCGQSTPAGPTASAGDKQLTIGVAFETLQTEFWIAGLDAIKTELAQRKIRVLEAIADGDANRQYEQVKNLITRKVDGIILVPKDAKTCLPMIKAAQAAGIPIVLFNRPSDSLGTNTPVAVVADNLALSRATVASLVARAKTTGTRHAGMLILGDLGDMNAIGRRDGFEAAVKGNESVVDVVARVPSEWNQEKAQAGVVNGLVAHPEIDFIFTSSDFLLPSIVSALKSAGKYKKAGEPGHVILGGFDGDATAYQMLTDGYLDATGVQDVYFEAQQAVQSLLDQRAGKTATGNIQDPGFVIDQENLKEKAPRMWGANVKKHR